MFTWFTEHNWGDQIEAQLLEAIMQYCTYNNFSDIIGLVTVRLNMATQIQRFFFNVVIGANISDQVAAVSLF